MKTMAMNQGKLERLKTHWLTPEHQKFVCNGLLEYGLVNRGNLPLSSGGTTDLKLNLRNVRGSVAAQAHLAEWYSTPLRYLGHARFAEIPTAMSGIAGVIQHAYWIPYISILKTPNTDGKDIIGSFSPGEEVVIIDDAITTGSTIAHAYHICRHYNLVPVAAVVLLDRDEGWRTNFAQWCINLPVWAGMTMVDFRCNVAILEA